MIDPKDFKKYATKHLGINSIVLDQYTSISNNYISPTIIEERQLNVASMDVFSRLMMDRIIFLGLPIDDYVANIIQAQLLYLESADPSKDISIYLNSPGGSVYAGLGIYDTMQYISPDKILKLKKELYTIIADHSGNTYKKVEKDSDRDYWMTADEAKSYGMIDEVLVRNHK